jgi:hypothetical protein
MKKLILLLPALAFGQTVYLRTPGTAFCRVTGATNATPIRMTVAAGCGLANGDIIVVNEVSGNWAANSHVKTAGSTTHLARKVSNLSGNSFDLLDLSDNPVAGSGTYTSRGRVGKATAYTAHSTFGVLMDGPSGPIATSLLDTSSTGRKHSSNRPYTLLQSRTNTLNGTAWYWGKDRQGETFSSSINQALRWYMDGTATSRTQMIEALKNPDQAYGSVSCTTEDWHCGLPNSTVADYARQYQAYSAQACAIGCSELSPTERSNLFDYWLRDVPWSQGGIDYTAAAWTRATWKLGYVGDTYTADLGIGTVTSSGNNIITGTGTNFVTRGVVVGDVVFAPIPKFNGGTQGCKVAAVTESQITCTDNFHSVTSTSYAVGRGWNPADNYLASEFQAKVYAYEERCGTCTAYVNARTPNYDNNLTIVGQVGAMAKGLAACGWGDQRGCLLAQQISEIFYDETLRQYSVINGDGVNGSNASYNSWRVNSALLELLAMHKRGIISGPDYSQNLLDDGVEHFLHQWLPVYGSFMSVGEPYAFNYNATNFWRAAFQSLHLLPTSNTRAKEMEWFLQQKMDYNGAADLQYNGSSYLWWLLLMRDPALTQQAPRTTLLTQNDYALCVANFGAGECDNNATHGERGGILARSGWGNADTVMHFDASAWSFLDHGAETVPGSLRIWKNGKGLLVNDGGFFYGSPGTPATRSILAIGGDANLTMATPAPYPRGSFRNVTRPQEYGGENFTWSRAVLTGIYNSGVTVAERQVFYAKPGGFLVHDSATRGSSGEMSARFHLALNGAGTAASPTYAGVNRSAKTFSNNVTGSAGITGKAFALGGGTIALTTENASDTNLNYTGAQGEAGRFMVCSSSDGSTCANGTSAEWVVVMETNTGSGALPTIVSPTVVGAHRIVEVQGASPWVVAFTKEGASATSLSFSTTFSGTGRYGVTGLAAGNWTATVGGTSVSGSPFTVTDAERTITFDAASGAVVLTQSGLALNIDTTSLPGGTVGVPYSQTLTASGGTSPYTWSLASGTLPAGLTRSGATISGTPTTAGTYSFTVGVTDAASGTDTQPLSITIGAAPSGGSSTVLRGVVVRGGTIK